jgi:hypothetical protein
MKISTGIDGFPYKDMNDCISDNCIGFILSPTVLLLVSMLYAKTISWQSASSFGALSKADGVLPVAASISVSLSTFGPHSFCQITQCVRLFPSLQLPQIYNWTS